MLSYQLHLDFLLNRFFRTFHYKLRVTKNYLSNRNSFRYIGKAEFARYVLSFPEFSVIQKSIETITRNDQFLIIKIKGYRDSVFWPIEFPVNDFLIILVELLYKRSWHRYQIDESFVDDGDVVVDCGASEGLFSLMVLDKASEIYAIEPLKEFNDALNCTFREYDQVNVINCALSDVEGENYISSNSIRSFVNDKGEHGVILNTLDNLFLHKNSKIDFIKADIEGGELDMLKGAQYIIKEFKPKLAVTAYHEGQESAETIASYILSISHQYKYRFIGISERQPGNPVMMHFWV